MKPISDSRTLSRPMGRREFLSLGLGLAACGGCYSSLLTRGQTPEQVELGGDEKEQLDLVGSYTRPFGLNAVKLESVGLVTTLAGTGSDPPPSAQRDMLINAMLQNSVDKPEKVLASPANSMVLVKGYLPPGIRRGETFDVEVRVPSGSETKSLHGGWLLKSEMRQVEILSGALHTGSIDGIVEGDVLVDSIFDGGQDPVSEVRGVILGRGVAQRTRELGLAISKQHASYRIVTSIAKAINARFHIVEDGSKQGVAEAKRDTFLMLAVPDNYRENMGHYLLVVRNIPLQETPVKRLERISLLEKKLLEPATAQAAALQLEACGKDAIDSLKKGLSSSDGEVRFCAAEALAYFDEPSAASVLAETARSQSAFRFYALTALAAMKGSVTSLEALTGLLNVSSAETRYGAFSALRTRSPDDPTTKGEYLVRPPSNPDERPRGGFRYHLMSTTAEPMIHFAKSKRAEVVLFGHEQRLRPLSDQQWIEAGSKILIKEIGEGKLKVSRFAPGEGEDKVETCSNLVDQMIRSVVKVGGTYADVIAGILDAKRKGLIEALVAVDALPKPSRRYEREELQSDPEPGTAPGAVTTEQLSGQTGTTAESGGSKAASTLP